MSFHAAESEDRGSVEIHDVLFQARIFRDKKDIFVWVMHLMIFVGFTLLLFMHALDRFVTSRLFEEYYATLNPFLFLRNLFGSAVLIGLILSVIRRLLLKKTGLVSSAMDVYAIVILAIITLSGFVVEGAKISSYSAYEEMIEEYASLETQEEARALEAVWVKEFGLVSPHDPSTDDTDTIVLGKELHEVSCSGCHAKPNWAFVSYAAAKITKPVALELDRIGFAKIAWYVHFLACFLGLALVPFTKMFHILATPISIMVNAVTEEENLEPANAATRLSIELDGCRHGGTCHSGCPVQERREAKLKAMDQSEPFLEYLGGRLQMEKGSVDYRVKEEN